MNRKIILCLALILGGGLSGCKPHHIPSAPSASQVGEWAGFPAGFQLETVSEPLTNEDNETQSEIGKPIWGCMYKNSDRSLVSFEIILCERGTLWGTNWAQTPKMVEKQVAAMRAVKSLEGTVENDYQKDFQIITLPNGCKAYFTVLGFGPGGTGLAGFSYERNYDLMVMEDFDAEDDVPAEKRMKNPISPTNDLPAIFVKLDAFLDTQQNVSTKP